MSGPTELITLIWVSFDLFLLQNLSIDYANFGQRRWCQKWKKGQPWSRPVTACKGINGSNRISRAFSKLNLKHQLSVLDFGGNETSWKVWQPETSTASLAVDPYFGKFIPALPFATVIPLWLATHDNYLWQNKKLMRCYMVGSWGVSTQASSHTHQLNWQSSILKFLFLLLSNWKKTKFWASWNKIT